MKKILYIIVILFVCSASAQAQVTLSKDVANLDGKPWLAITKIHKNKFDVRDLSSTTIAIFSFEKRNDNVHFKGEFPTIEKTYEVNYPVGTTLETILASYSKNGVIVDGKINLAGLKNYCDSRKIKITKLLSEEEQKQFNDSIQMKGKRFSFSIHGGLAYSFRNYPEQMRTMSFYSPWGYHHGTVYQFESSKVKGVLTSNLGFDLEFRVRKNLFLSIGSNYTKLVYQTRDSIECYTTAWYDYTPKVYYDTVENFTFREEYYFASLPICLFYRLNCKDNFYTFGAGASFAVLFRTRTLMNYSMAGRDAYNYKSVIANPIFFAKVGAFGNLGGGRALGFELEFKYYGQYTTKPANFFTLGCNMVLKL